MTKKKKTRKKKTRQVCESKCFPVYFPHFLFLVQNLADEVRSRLRNPRNEQARALLNASDAIRFVSMFAFEFALFSFLSSVRC
jgi:hypothetical protein